MKWTIVILPVVFEVFEVVYIFLLLFSFQIIVNWLKVNFNKNLGSYSPHSPPSPPRTLFLQAFNINFVTMIQKKKKTTQNNTIKHYTRNRFCHKNTSMIND